MASGQFYKVNCFRKVGDVLSPATHYVVATSDENAVTAIMDDAAAAGYECENQQLIPMMSEVIIGS